MQLCVNHISWSISRITLNCKSILSSLNHALPYSYERFCYSRQRGAPFSQPKLLPMAESQKCTKTARTQATWWRYVLSYVGFYVNIFLHLSLVVWEENGKQWRDTQAQNKECGTPSLYIGRLSPHVSPENSDHESDDEAISFATADTTTARTRLTHVGLNSPADVSTLSDITDSPHMHAPEKEESVAAAFSEHGMIPRVEMWTRALLSRACANSVFFGFWS